MTLVSKSITKTVNLHIGFHFNNPNIKCYIYGSEIANKVVVCDQRMHLSKDISVNNHIYTIVKKHAKYQ